MFVHGYPKVKPITGITILMKSAHRAKPEGILGQSMVRSGNYTTDMVAGNELLLWFLDATACVKLIGRVSRM